MRRNSILLCALALFMLALSSVPSSAQTTAAGPYLATPSWDQQIKCDTLATCQRFIVLSNWNSEAVLDRETGLVWERQPNLPDLLWSTSVSQCRIKFTGGRYGWRLPAIEELSSLITIDSSGNLALPSGHPFELGNSPDGFWSATTYEPAPILAWNLTFLFGGSIVASNKTAFRLDAWCVRGGNGLDAQ
jgi:hypothetical protein